MWKMILRSLRRTFLLLGSLVLLYLLLGLILSLIPTRPGRISCETRQKIYFQSNGIHLNIVLARELWEAKMGHELNIPPEIKYLSFGWGDKQFYLQTPTWGQMTFRTTAQALLWASASAMHTRYYYRRSDTWRPLRICDEQADTLLGYIGDSFARNAAGQLIAIPDHGYTRQDRFYEARGRYSFIHTCNNWVNIGLQRAGIKTALWSPFDFGVTHHLPRTGDDR